MFERFDLNLHQIYKMQNQTKSVLEETLNIKEEMFCPLCLASVDSTITGPLDLKLWHCHNCELVFKDPKHRPSQSEEEQRYLKHQNDKSDKDYIEFLKHAINPALEFFEPEAEGLDFGCGPNPVLSSIVKEVGYECSNYDPIFFPDFPDERMDFLFATESFEHFFNPIRDIKLITAILRPGGILTVMTNRWKELDQLTDWWYIRDKTHVAFYHRKTFDYICAQFGYSILFDDGDKVIILEKGVVFER